MADDEREPTQRPRVIDKRVGSRPAGTSSPAPAEQPQAQPEPQPSAPSVPHPGPAPVEDVWTPEAEAEARAIAAEIAKRPSIEWVVNTAVTLANVAATKLDMGAAADAQLAIDALGGLLKEVGPRLGEVETPLRQTLAQLQMAYAETVTGKPTTP